MNKLKANTQSGVYSGNVKITLKKGGIPYKVINQHNSGTAAFFRYILNTVKGSVLPNDRPGKIKLVYSTGASTYATLYESVTDAADSGTSEQPQATIVYSFFIPETVVERKTLIGAQLISLNGVEYALAELDVPITITSNTNIELDWTLNICNN